MTRQQVIQWVRDNLPHWPTQYPPDTSPPGWSWLSTLQFGYVLINTDETDMVREDEVSMYKTELTTPSWTQNMVEKLSQENETLREQLHSLFERVSGCQVSEFSSEQVNYLADMIEGQMDADEGCINKLKSENNALRAALSLKGLELECLALARGVSSAITELRHRDTEHDDDD